MTSAGCASSGVCAVLDCVESVFRRKGTSRRTLFSDLVLSWLITGSSAMSQLPRFTIPNISSRTETMELHSKREKSLRDDSWQLPTTRLSGSSGQVLTANLRAPCVASTTRTVGYPRCHLQLVFSRTSQYTRSWFPLAWHVEMMNMIAEDNPPITLDLG